MFIRAKSVLFLPEDWDGEAADCFLICSYNLSMFMAALCTEIKICLFYFKTLLTYLFHIF